MTEDMKAKMDASFEDISTKRALAINPSDITKIEFIGPSSGTTNFESHLDSCMKRVAAGTGIPKDVLIGATAGAITGSEINVKSLYATISQIQQSIEPMIRELVRRMGYSDDFEIEWNTRFAYDEEQEAKIDNYRAQTLQIKSAWMTKNEIRAESGLDPIEGGDQTKQDITIGVAGLKTPDQQQQTRNPQGVNYG
jgi:hypothetical protein